MKRSLFGAAALAVVALSVVLIGTASAAKPPAPPAPTGNCPSNITNFVAANNVDALHQAPQPSTYFFDSLVNQSPNNGVPGLVGYCVYTRWW